MSFFADAGKNEGIEVWRLEKMTPVRWPLLGEFYSGDCYLVLHTIKPRSRYDVYYWLGKDSTVDEQGGIAYSAVELDQSLGDVPVQHREVQDHETGEFVALWKNHGGLRYLEGGVASAFHHVTPKEYKPRLLHVKGRRSARVREVKCSAESLNDGDPFILDAGMTLYMWNGKNINRYEKLKAMEAQRFILQDRKGLPEVVVMAEADSDKRAAFWSLLGGEQPIKPAEDGTDELCDRMHAKDLRLFTLQEGAWEPSGLTAPFARNDLQPTRIYLLDTNSPTGLFVWVGNESPVELRKTAMQLAETWLRTNERPQSTPICRLHEGSETALFKTMFHQVEVPRPKRWSQMGSVASMRESEVNIAALHQERAQVQVLAARDRTEETIVIWRVDNFDLVEVPVEQHGEFYDGDSYVIEYVYRPKKARSEVVLYFWQGKYSTVDEVGASAMFVTRLDNERHQGRAVQVRVPMGKEPLDFLLLFQGKMIIHKGGAVSGFRRSGHATADSGQNELAVRLYHIHGATPQECKAVQVQPTAASLNSNDVFILVHAASASTLPTLWKGRGASLEEEQLAQELAQRLAAGPPHVLTEGSESEDFWAALGGQAEYASDPAMCDPTFLARLFHISNATGALRCEEVFNFTQEDLLEEDVLLLDVKTAVFAWIGNLAHKDEIANAPKIAKEYIATCPDNRGDVPVIVMRQGAEPLLFKCHFNWSEAVAERLSSRSSATPEKQKAQIGRMLPDVALNVPVKEEAKMSSDHAEEQKEFYPLERLQKETPPGVPADQKERFLSPEDFKTAFNMSKNDFDALALWKKKDLKKKCGLF